MSGQPYLDGSLHHTISGVEPTGRHSHMIKHLRKNPIALLALFLALGGTSYATSMPAADGPVYAAVAVVPVGPHPTIQFNAARSAGLTAANFSAPAENVICVNGLKETPRNLQVTSTEVMLPAVQINPAYGPCKGKQAGISFWTHQGNAASYGSAFVSVVA
jgi:hypothetical protein